MHPWPGLFVNLDFLKRLIENFSSPFSDSNLTANRVFEDHEGPNTQIEYLDSKHALLISGDDITKISVSSTIRQSLQAGHAPLVMNGQEQREIDIEKTSGMVLNSNSTQYLEGSCRIGKALVVQTIARKLDIKGMRVQ